MEAVEVIAEGTFGGATSVTFSGISQDYQHLTLDLRTSSEDNVQYSQGFLVQINGETSNYGYITMYAHRGFSFAAGYGHAATQALMGYFPSQKDDAERRGAIKLWFGNYSQTDMNPSWVLSMTGWLYNNDQGSIYASATGTRESTAAITSITVISYSGNFDSDSRYCMLGWRSS
jgi:hypothetical protein